MFLSLLFSSTECKTQQLLDLFCMWFCVRDMYNNSHSRVGVHRPAFVRRLRTVAFETNTGVCRFNYIYTQLN